MPARAVNSPTTARAPRSRLVSAATSGTLAYAAAMRLATFLPPGGGEPLAGEVRGDEVAAFDDRSPRLYRLASRDRTPAGREAFALADVELLAPVPRPRAIFGIGLNYATHAAETGGGGPAQPTLFMEVPAGAA